MRLVALAAVLLPLCLLTGCQTASQNHSTFLVTGDAGWDKWLNDEVSISVKGFPLWQLRELEAFKDGNYYLDGHTAGGVLVNLQASNISRREVFWMIHKQTGLLVDLYNYEGVTVLRFRSDRMAKLKGN